MKIFQRCQFTLVFTKSAKFHGCQMHPFKIHGCHGTHGTYANASFLLRKDCVLHSDLLCNFVIRIRLVCQSYPYAHETNIFILLIEVEKCLETSCNPIFQSLHFEKRSRLNLLSIFCSKPPS